MRPLAASIVAFFLFGASSFALAASATPARQFSDLVEKGDYQQDLDQLKRDSELFPYNESLRRNLAFAYAQVAQREMKLTHYAVASSYLAQALELYPDNGDFKFLRGVSLYFGKEYEAARPLFEGAGRSAASLYYLGRISYDTGDLTAAVSSWRSALELDPGNDTIKEALDKAERELPVETRMDKGYSSMFDVSFDAEVPSGLALQVTETLERAYGTVGSDFDLFPTTRIPVLLYTKSDYRSLTAGPD